METKKVSEIVSRSSRKERFDKRQIMEIVKSVESGVPRKKLQQEYSFSSSILHEWLSKYGSEAYQASRRASFQPSQKRSVMRAVEGGMSVKEAAVVFGIKDSRRIAAWIKRSKQENTELAANLSSLKQKKTKPSPEEQQSLEQQLAQAQLKIRALETMIDIAEEQLKIDIRKKSGAKQSPK